MSFTCLCNRTSGTFFSSSHYASMGRNIPWKMIEQMQSERISFHIGQASQPLLDNLDTEGSNVFDIDRRCPLNWKWSNKLTRWSKKQTMWNTILPSLSSLKRVVLFLWENANWFSISYVRWPIWSRSRFVGTIKSIIIDLNICLLNHLSRSAQDLVNRKANENEKSYLPLSRWWTLQFRK